MAAASAVLATRLEAPAISLISVIAASLGVDLGKAAPRACIPASANERCADRDFASGFTSRRGKAETAHLKAVRNRSAHLRQRHGRLPQPFAMDD